MESAYTANPNTSNKNRWSEAQNIYRTLTLTITENKQFVMREYVEEGENTGHQLAMMAKAKQDMSYIEAITDLEGVTYGMLMLRSCTPFTICILLMFHQTREG